LRPEAGPNVIQPQAMPPLPEAPKKARTDENEALSRFALEVARQLGKVMANEDSPARTLPAGTKGTAQLLLKVGSDGKVAGVSVWAGSGHDTFDQFAMEKLTALRLPRIPSEYRRRAFSVQIPVMFAVKKARH
jgi:TonB family protein